MSRHSKGVPKYCLHRHSGQAVVRIAGHDHYLGKHGSPESYEKYAELITRWQASGGRRDEPIEHPDQAVLSINELILAYWRYVEGRYVRDGQPTDEQAAIRAALGALRRSFGLTRAVDFGPKSLKVVRQQLVENDLSRKYVNDSANRIRRMFRWAVSEELIPVAVYEALRTVEGLRRGETSARESRRVLPVEESSVAATLPHLPTVVADMVQVQRLLGCRPDEVCSLRPVDLERTSEVWQYRPAHHKMEHRGQSRVIFVGPRAQAILEPYLSVATEKWCFSPTESESRRNHQRRAKARQPRRHLKRKQNAQRLPGERYTTDSYRRAIQRACDRAGIPRWTPNQLRHTAATEIRRKYGLEAAQSILGHTNMNVTEIYAERNYELAGRVAAGMG